MINKIRLDQELFNRGLISTRSQAETYIKLGYIKVDSKVVKKPGFYVTKNSDIQILADNKYVSRAGLKLASVAQLFDLNFKNKVVLDIGSSTGGFTDFALQNGAKKVVAVDLGTNQMHSSLRSNPKIELHEKTDIRDMNTLSPKPDIIVMDLSFVSLRDILPKVIKLSSKKTLFVAMVKPQFEAQKSNIKHKGVIKNENIRRAILKEFEVWATQYFYIINKQDSQVSGEKGNKERFILMGRL